MGESQGGNPEESIKSELNVRMEQETAGRVDLLREKLATTLAELDKVQEEMKVKNFEVARQNMAEIESLANDIRTQAERLRISLGLLSEQT